MKVVGLVTEYNPFHNGHKYHALEARRLTGADYVIAVMSGSFVQRGAPAIIDKYSRTWMALQNGVDLVLELPACYATASAEYFAYGAVSLLDRLGIVDYLCFGSECGEVSLLQEAAGLLLNAPDRFHASLKQNLKEGATYPAARVKALEQTASSHREELVRTLREPNNILGIEYLKALRQLHSPIRPVTIPRISAHYHDSQLSGAISSATAIRRAIQDRDGGSPDFPGSLEHSVPENVIQILQREYLSLYPVTMEDFGQILRYQLLRSDRAALSSYLDLSPDLAGRLKNVSDLNKPIEVLLQEVKTRNTTLTRISRAFIHMLLNIQTEDMEEYKETRSTGYARVLGLKRESSGLLRTVEDSGRIPVITKVADAVGKLDPVSIRMLDTDLFAGNLYNQIIFEKYHTKLPNEYRHGVCIL